jgi:hypothetical protein
MTNIKTLLGATSLLGFAVLTLAGCPSEDPKKTGKTEKTEQQIICEKMVECKQVAEGRTVEECASQSEIVYNLLEDDEICGPLLELYQEALLCMSEELSCDEIAASNGSTAAPSNDQPCFEERKAAQDAIDKARAQNEAQALNCMRPYKKAVLGAKAAADEQDRQQ